MNRLQLRKKIGVMALTAALAATLAPPGVFESVGIGPKAASAACTTSLTMTGDAEVPVTSIERNQVEMISIHYTLDPDGTREVTSTRPPNDVVFVADTSGSMDKQMDTTKAASASNPKRIDILKTASQTLIANFKTNNYDQLGLVRFSRTADKLVDLGKNYDTVKNSIAGFTPNGNTNIDEALTDAMDMLTAAGTSNPKQIILLTDGAATAYTNSKGQVDEGNETKSRDEAKADALLLKNKGIKVYTIALATEGSAEIDLPLLQYIATTTGGNSYRASSVSELQAIFNSITTVTDTPATLSNVVLRQPMPEGFILAPGKNPSNVTYNSATRQVEVNLGDIPYPFVREQYDLTVNMIPDTAAGNYALSDAVVSYTNECNGQSQFPIRMGMDLTVSLRIKDMYGNVYLANRDGLQGQVQRVRNDEGPNSLQWTIRENETAISDIKFESPDPSRPDDSIVHIYYRGGAHAAWNLLPTAPTGFQLKDGNGSVISDTGWHKGTGWITAFSGSVHQLPASTVYGNEDFRGSYIAGYLYRIGSANWAVFDPSTGVLLQDGRDISLGARAYTYAVSGNGAVPLSGAPAASQVSLDSTGPVISWMKTNSDLEPAKDADITVTATETLSPISSIKVWVDGNPYASLTADAGRLVSNGNTSTFSFKLSEVPGYAEEAARIGWHQLMIEATSVGGTSGTGGSTVNPAGTPETFVVNPGPTGLMETQNYTPFADIADRPVNVGITTSHPVTARFNKPAFTVKDKYYLISSSSEAPDKLTAAWKKLPASRLPVTTETDVTKGTYYVFLKLVDDQGVASITDMPAVIQFDMEQNRN